MANNINTHQNTGAAHDDGLLPNFCDGRILLLLILVAEGLAIVLTLNQGTHVDGLWVNLGNISLFIQAITLTDAAVLCLLKRKLHHLSSVALYVLLYIFLQFVTVLITLAAHQILQHLGLHTELNLTLQLIRNVCISAIITGAMLRYFYVRHQNQIRQKSESEARVQALQARIRPHFLFNSLNTIANLIHQQADMAEEALLDLAELFRSTLGKQSHISLDDELEIVRRYLRIEKLRLGNRLSVDWDIPPELKNVIVPALILQPLIENAIYHGIEPLPDGGHVKIHAEKGNNRIRIEIHNPLAQNFVRQRSRGNQVAVENIRQRLTLAYGNEASLEQKQDETNYTVALTFPIDNDANSNS